MTTQPMFDLEAITKRIEEDSARGLLDPVRRGAPRCVIEFRLTPERIKEIQAKVDAKFEGVNLVPSL